MDAQPSGTIECSRCRMPTDGSTMRRLGWHPSNPLWSCSACVAAQRATGTVLK